MESSLSILSFIFFFFSLWLGLDIGLIPVASCSRETTQGQASTRELPSSQSLHTTRHTTRVDITRTRTLDTPLSFASP
ncbi:hypothetical protein M440DRAFT_1402047 [Trichoderma longibrachiatum ATCC 18648]|uniref:Secreted protein n=1 Tax=Trichoderma longibrachiatum ATCC 18648 TaxID=983965 RepID=A0A2T4C1W5_TRILO|nr:hypothetical protein M440DRAFT_1402047 [Trichoderma longibrachiatum ATCC 18648]